ncbi:hypothetical protein [Allokutzneria albata]|uniref:Uncharacterized protein n=1 Tax=Allokutzneria albata TaxID=211114 RepID=A0A1H0BSU8_ALLAB|nr:hypothetical protein [Allokutzneria albata]SDN48660.1 hypothetical protein SAMN04489726_6821 [Allokutzneria albata]
MRDETATLRDRSRVLAFVLLAVYVTLHLSVCCSGQPDASAPVTHVSHGHSHDLPPCEPHAHSADDTLCTALPRTKGEPAPLADVAVILPTLGLVLPPPPPRRRRDSTGRSVHSGRSLLLTICVARN